jgi:hypothetical protein
VNGRDPRRLGRAAAPRALFEGMQRRMPNPPPEGRLMWFGQTLSIDDFLEKMVEEQRLIYQFEVQRAYGMY